MTADEARERVGEIRAELRRVMRAIDRPEPDWKAAEEAAGDCMSMCGTLHVRCLFEGMKAERENEVSEHD